jgi:hypothetical protein
VVQTRTYGTPEFYAEMGFRDEDERQTEFKDNVTLLRGDPDLEI